MKLLSIFVLLTLITFRAPAANESGEFKVVVQFGDKISTFLLALSVDGGTVERLGGNQTRKVTLDKVDAEYIGKKVAAVFKAPSNDVRFCDRRNVTVSSRVDSRLGCIGSNTPVASAATELADALNTASKL